MRTIHYGIRFAIVLILSLMFYLGVTFLFHQVVQFTALITLLFIGIGAERLWVLLDWIGPVVGTMNKKKQEQEQKQIVEYLLECSLRYGSPLVIAAMRSRKRISLHIVARFLRKSDIVVRSSAGYLLVLMPFTTLEQAAIPLKRITSRLPIKEVVVSDVEMLKELVAAQRADDNGLESSAASRELRSMCFRALDIRLASIKSSEEVSGGTAVYNLFEPGSPNALAEWLGAFDVDVTEEEVSALMGEKDGSAVMAAL